MDSRRNEIRNAARRTCEWIFTDDRYLEWKNSKPPGLLWIRGKPGCGKSTLVKHLVETTKESNSMSSAFFFHSRGTHLQKSPLGLLRSLLYQLLQQAPEVRLLAGTLYKEKHRTEGKSSNEWEWKFDELQNLFDRCVGGVARYHSVQLFIDGLDECGEENARYLMAFFHRLMIRSSNHKGGIRLCFSSRHYPVIALNHGLSIRIEDENTADITSYVQNELGQYLRKFSEVQEISDDIVRHASGTFSWVNIAVSATVQKWQQGASAKSIRRSLQEVPAELDELYDQILRWPYREDSPQTLLLFQWTCFAVRSLSIEELWQAMNVEVDTAKGSLSEYQDPECYFKTSTQLEREITSLTRGLVEVKEQYGQKTVHFIHRTVHDFFLGTGLKFLSGSSDESTTGLAHLRLSRSCIKYMATGEIREIPEKFGTLDNLSTKLADDFPFLRYAVMNWIVHAEIAEAERISQSDLPSLISWPKTNQFMQRWIRLYQEVDSVSDKCPASNTTLLHTVSRHNLLSVIKTMFDTAPPMDIDVRDGKGNTPLSLAASNGHVAMVQLLLERGASINLPNEPRENALKTASMIELLLGYGTDINAPGGSTFRVPSLEDHIAITKLLLDHGADPNVISVSGMIPLHWASLKGHIAMTNLLVNHGANVNATDVSGMTSLHWASWKGHITITNLLLSYGADVNATGVSGMTPLHWASTEGRSEIVKLLLDQGANPNTSGNSGEAPLHLAGMRGHHNLAELLLHQGANLNAPSLSEITPLHWASMGGRPELAKLLLDQGTDPNTSGISDVTSVHLASKGSHPEMAKVLLDHSPQLSASDDNSLQAASTRGKSETARSLLAPGADSHASYKPYGNALQAALLRGDL